MRELEHKEAVRFMSGIKRLADLKWPQLEWIFAIPNGGLRNRMVAIKLKAEGVKAGVHDYFLPVAKGMPGYSIPPDIGGRQYHGLYLELKAVNKNRKATAGQREFAIAMDANGYAVALCHGSGEALDAVMAYMEGTWQNDLETFQ
jgi:hypothetical protein